MSLWTSDRLPSAQTNDKNQVPRSETWPTVLLHTSNGTTNSQAVPCHQYLHIHSFTFIFKTLKVVYHHLQLECGREHHHHLSPHAILPWVSATCTEAFLVSNIQWHVSLEFMRPGGACYMRRAAIHPFNHTLYQPQCK